MTTCPEGDDLVRLVDGALVPEAAGRVEAHLAECARCREAARTLRRIVEDVRSPPLVRLDVPAHVRAVMARLDRPPTARAPRVSRAWVYGGALAAAACVALVMGVRGRSPDAWQARGGSGGGGGPWLERDVGVLPYAARGTPHAIAAGDAIDRDTPLTAGVRNVGGRPGYLLLFAVDARGAVRWIAPPYERAGDDPPSAVVGPGAELRLLATTAVFDDLPPGPLRIVSVVTASPAHVSDVEALEASGVTTAGVAARLPGAVVRETRIEVRP
jgi:hypothetical protein